MNAYGEDVDQLDPASDNDARTDDQLDEDVEEFDDDDLDDDDLDDDDLDDDDYDDDDDEPEDAGVEDIDFVIATYREDGSPVATGLSLDLANDLDELIAQLRRLPGDAGALGAVSIAGEFFVLVRVRGGSVKVILSDAVAANDWPLAHDVVDFLGLDVPDEDDDPELVGDTDMLADSGLTELALENLVEELDDSDEQVQDIMDRLRFGQVFARAVDQQNKDN